MESTFAISPVVFAVAGLVIFIFGQFRKGRNKIFLSVAGLLAIGLFMYKLLTLPGRSGFVYGDSGAADFHLSFYSICLLLAGINILGFILWLLAILQVTFERSIPRDARSTILLSGGLIMITGLLIYKLFGMAGAFLSPVLMIGFFIYFKNHYTRPKAE